ncbi:hypothetical protein KP509_02G047600 [Ceratopteris richardii]|uniref:protein-S-isoprenylcysteine alpha-carbonyl methylesterase n=1 Tax=Ceratopteris richardii TaxID=49495 RepID=A0A8T2V5F1_CERRI|nr:hypothetical protein KP509_02G047600 [Ceratopteris richardii]
MEKLHTLESPMVYASDSLRKEVNLRRYISLDTASDLFHLSPLAPHDKPLPRPPPRRSFTESDMNIVSNRRSFRDEFEHAAAETYLITKLAFTLLKFLGIGYRWLSKLGALAFYALFLMPGFLQVGYYYFFDKRIHRSITYGPNPRNRLDLYLPENMDSPKPVVAFVTGGAWIIGYKAWGSLLGLQLVEKDIIVACIDYRNFPQGTISDMVEDVKQGISFICNNAASYGGDPNRLYLAGQSAGAHLAACALIEQAILENKAKSVPEESQIDMKEKELSWRATQFKAYFAISGGYNLTKLINHFHERGLYRSLFLSIMEGEQSLLRYSPELRVQSLLGRARSLLPPVYLFHGTADYSIPYDASTTFANVLESYGVHVATRIYDGKTHTDLFLQVFWNLSFFYLLMFKVCCSYQLSWVIPT